MKKILFAIIAVIAIAAAAVAILAFIAPTSFEVERDIVINRPRSDVFDYVRLLKNQNEWGPWLKKDPNTRLDYEGIDGTVGFKSRWDSENSEVGAGEQEIVKLVEDERIDVDLRFKKPYESRGKGYTILETAGEGKTKVRWGFGGDMPRPMNILLLFMDFDKEAGQEIEEGLATLKKILETQN